MSEAESFVQVNEEIITRRRYLSFQDQKLTVNSRSQSPGYAKMLREIKNWGIVLLILGAIQLFSSGFENTWAILLIIVGLGSFYFRSPAIFITYGTTMAWAAISNALSSSGGWQLFSLLQVYLTYSIIRQFFQFRTSFDSSSTDKAERPFPWTSFFLGLFSFIGITTVFLGAILFVGITGNEQIPTFLSFTEGLSIIFAVLGFSMGLAAILSKYHHKVLSIIGIVASGLVLVVEVGLGLLG
jgi:hypothetical protein